MGAVYTKLEHIKIGKESIYSLLRSHLAEFIGTALLAVVGIGGAIMGHRTVNTPAYDQVNLTGRALANGLILAVMILNFGAISGAHFNPAVSFAFCLRSVYPWSKLLSYWVVQIAGAITGAAIVRGIFPDNPEDDHLGRPLAHYGWTTGLYVEILLTFVHILNILGTATRSLLIGTGTAFSVGGWVATSFLFTGPLSGAVLNPAIALGALVISGDWTYGWIYPVGEFAGTLIAVGVTWILHPTKEHIEKSVAEGSEPNKERHHGHEAA